jgi:hypothetical protein
MELNPLGKKLGLSFLALNLIRTYDVDKKTLEFVQMDCWLYFEDILLG